MTCAALVYPGMPTDTPCRGFMIGNYIGLLSAFVGAVAVPSRRVPSSFVAHPFAMSLVTVGVVAVAGFVIGAAFVGARRVRVG